MPCLSIASLGACALVSACTYFHAAPLSNQQHRRCLCAALRPTRLTSGSGQPLSIEHCDPTGTGCLTTVRSLHYQRESVPSQVVAGLRCRKNKTVFLLGMLLGKRWAPEELFTSEAGARPEANTILSGMTTFLQRSSNVATKCVHPKQSFSFQEPHCKDPYVPVSVSATRVGINVHLSPSVRVSCKLQIPIARSSSLCTPQCSRHLSYQDQPLAVMGKLGS